MKDRRRSSSPASGEMSPPADAPLAQAENLFRSAKLAQVESFVANTPRLRVHATNVLLAQLRGMALFDAGDVVSAIGHLREAVEGAIAECPDLEFSCRLALFARQSQYQAPEATLPAISRLRQLVSSAGDAKS